MEIDISELNEIEMKWFKRMFSNEIDDIQTTITINEKLCENCTNLEKINKYKENIDNLTKYEAFIKNISSSIL